MPCSPQDVGFSPAELALLGTIGSGLVAAIVTLFKAVLKRADDALAAALGRAEASEGRERTLLAERLRDLQLANRATALAGNSVP